MKSLVKITVLPSWSDENKITVRVEPDGDGLILICRRISQLPMVRHGLENNTRKRNYLQWERRISAEKFDELFSTLKHASVPVIPEYPMGCDGCGYELELNVCGYKSKFSWWSSPPEGYGSLNDFIHKLLEYSGAYSKQNI